MSQPSAGEWRDREHHLPVRVYYEDTDFTGVVFHGAFVNFLERGRSDALRLAGIHHATLRGLEPAIAFAITRMEIDYRRAATIDDALIVRTRIEGARGPRLVMAQRIDRGAERIVDARVEAACVGLDGRARRPPPFMVDAIRPLIF